MDPFRYKSEEEIKKMISDFWSECEYLVRLRILLKIYPGYSVSKLESRGIAKMWKALSLGRQKEVYEDQYKYQF